MQTGPGAKPAPAKWRNTAAARQIRQQPKDGRQPRHAARRRSRPSRPKPQCSTPIRPPPAGSWSNVFVFAWPKRNSRPHFRGSCLRGAVARFQYLSGSSIENGRRFQPGRLTMFLGLLMSASPILMLTCKDGLSTTTATPKPPAPSLLTKHRPRAPEAGLWPAREQLPDVPAIPALAPRRNYLRPKPIIGLTRNAIWISKLAEKILLGPEQHDALGPKTPLRRTRNRETTPRL